MPAARLRAVEPGRLLVLITGEVDDVRRALRRGRAAIGDDLVDELFLPKVHASVFDALATTAARAREVQPDLAEQALGLVECSSVAATLLAADAAVKQAPVQLCAVRIGEGLAGKGLIALTGDVADVEAAVAKAALLAEERQKLVRTVVIPRQADGIFERLLHL